MARLTEAADKAAATDATVGHAGETGTGKELVVGAAREERAFRRPFVAINCAAIVEGLLESEMFGHEKGAFSADARKDGRIAEAAGGTLFS